MAGAGVATGEVVDSQASLVGRHLASQTDLLGALVAAERSDVTDICVGDFHHQTIVQNDFPVAGCKRIIATRTPTGSDTLIIPTTGVQVLPGNVSRLGGMIVNYGANALILYLTDATSAPYARPGRGALYLAASGGAWDFRLGNLLWCGNVTAVAQTAQTTITVCEV